MTERWGGEGRGGWCSPVSCVKSTVTAVIVAIVLATDRSFVETQLLVQLSDWLRRFF